MRTKEVQKDPLFAIWKSHWYGFKKYSPHKYIEKGLVDHIRRYHMVQLAILSHEAIKLPWVKYTPIFMELKG